MARDCSLRSAPTQSALSKRRGAPHSEGTHRGYEPLQLRTIELPVRAHAAADVDARRLHAFEGVANIRRVQSAGEEDRDAGVGGDAPADVPVVHAARAAELLHLQRRIPGVEE